MSRSRAIRSQARTCKTSSQMVCAPTSGLLEAVSWEMSASRPLIGGPNHDGPSKSNLSSSAIRSVSLMCQRYHPAGHFPDCPSSARNFAELAARHRFYPSAHLLGADERGQVLIPEVASRFLKRQTPIY